MRIFFIPSGSEDRLFNLTSTKIKGSREMLTTLFHFYYTGFKRTLNIYTLAELVGTKIIHFSLL